MELVGTVILDFPASQTVRNKRLSLPVYGILLWQPEVTNTHGVSLPLDEVKPCRDGGRTGEIHQVPYIRTFKLRTFKDVNVCSHVQLR